MFGKALYYPYIDIADSKWLKSAILFWDEIQTIAPSAITAPYRQSDSQICAKEGYLRPLHCDLHPRVLDELGRRVFRLMTPLQLGSSARRRRDPLRRLLTETDAIGREIEMRARHVAHIHPEKMAPELRALFVQSGGLALMSGEKISPRLRRRLRNLDLDMIHPDKLSDEMRSYFASQYGDNSGWILVEGHFAAIYMAALAALLSKEIQISPLTSEASYSAINLRCLVDDVAVDSPSAAKGAIVSTVMKGLRIDPSTPIKRILAFRRRRTDQLAELAGAFDELKAGVGTCASRKELESAATVIFANKIQPKLAKLKKELKQQSIQSMWQGVQRAITVTAPMGGMLAAVTGFTGPMLLGAGAFIAVTDIGVNSYFAREKMRAASPYTYLLDIGRKFSTTLM